MAWAYQNMDDYLRSKGLTIVNAAGGQGVRFGCTNSWHCEAKGALARDWGLSAHGRVTLEKICELLAPFASGSNRIIEELFFQSSSRGWFYDSGRAFTPSSGLREGHRDHVHVQ